MAPEDITNLELRTTVWINVYCVDPNTGNADGPYTQSFDVPYAADVSDIEDEAQLVADAFCQSGYRFFGLAPLPEQGTFAVWEVRDFLYYYTNRGI